MAKKATPKQAVLKKAAYGDQSVLRGSGGETHQTAEDGLTTREKREEKVAETKRHESAAEGDKRD